MIQLTHHMLTGIMLSQAKAHGTTPEEQLIRFVRAGLAAERERILAERAAARVTTEGGAETASYPIVDHCTETFLRQICGEWWPECWWASTCALSGNPT